MASFAAHVFRDARRCAKGDAEQSLEAAIDETAALIGTVLQNGTTRTKYVRMAADQSAHVEWGEDPTADDTSLLLFAGQPEYFEIPAGFKLSVRTAAPVVPDEPVLEIAGTPVLSATEDEAYTGFTATASNGTEPYVYSLVGTWPAGIDIDPDTGEVSGTPTETGAFTGLSVRVTDDNSDTADLDSFTLTVAAAAGAPLAPIITLLASSDRGASTSDGISNDPHPVFGLVFDENAAAGDIIRQKLDGVTNGTPYALQAEDLTNGYLPVDAFDALPSDDTYPITYTHEKAGAESLPSNEISYVLNRSLGTVTAALDGVPGDDTGDTTPTINVGPGTYTFTEDDIAEVRAADGTVLGSRTITAGDVTAEIAPVTLSTLALGSHTLTAYIYRGGLFTSTTAKTIGVVVGPNAPLDLYVTPADQGTGPLQTDETQPTIRVEIDADAEAGWDVTLVINSVDNASGTLTGTDITNGYADIQVTSALADDTPYDFAAYVTDDAGIYGSPISVVSIQIGSAYAAQGVTFDGTNDYLTLGAGLTGAADSKVGLFVCWFKIAGGNGATRIFYYSGVSNALRFYISRLNTNVLSVFGRNAVSSTVLSMTSTTTYTDSMTGWACFMAAWDLAAGVTQMYVGDTSVRAGSPTAVDDTIDHTGNEAAFGARSTAVEKMFGDIADPRLWIDQTLDLSVEANRRKFIDAAGKPVDPADSGLTASILDLHGPTVTWHTNQGSGGGFTENGALTDAATSPSD